MTLSAYRRAIPIDFDVPFHRAALVLLLALFFSMPVAARSVDTPLARFRNRPLYAADLAPTHLDLRRAPPESDVAARDKWLWEARADRLWERMDPLYREYAKRHRLEPTRAQFDSYVTALRRMSDEPISIRDIRDFARQAIRRHNIFRHLYREHGGRVIFQQFGPEPLDALHRFWLDHEAAGQFEIHSPELRQAFYNYFHIPHTVSSPRQGRLEMETPWWEMTDSHLAALEEDDPPPRPLARIGETIITQEMAPRYAEEFHLQDLLLQTYRQNRGIHLSRIEVESAVIALDDRLHYRRRILEGLRRVHESGHDSEAVWRDLFETDINRNSWMTRLSLEEMSGYIREDEESVAAVKHDIESWESIRRLGLIPKIEDRIIEEFGYDLHGLRGAIGRYAATLMRSSTLEFFDSVFEARFKGYFPSQRAPAITVPAEKPTFPFEAALLLDTAYAGALVSAIEMAESEILVIMHFSERGATTDRILAALWRAAERGVAIRVIFGQADTFARCLADRIAVRIEPRIGARAVLIDGGRMIAGSHSWIDSDYATRRHASLLVNGPAEAFVAWTKLFEERWNTAEMIAETDALVMAESVIVMRKTTFESPLRLVTVQGRILLAGPEIASDLPAAIESLIRRSSRL